MKKLLLLLFPIVAFAATVTEETKLIDNAPHFRLTNHEYYTVNCVYQDVFSYFTFQIAPGASTKWIPVERGSAWICK